VSDHIQLGLLIALVLVFVVVLVVPEFLFLTRRERTVLQVGGAVLTVVLVLISVIYIVYRPPPQLNLPEEVVWGLGIRVVVGLVILFFFMD
jgi:hypothetical protein